MDQFVYDLMTALVSEIGNSIIDTRLLNSVITKKSF